MISLVVKRFVNFDNLHITSYSYFSKKISREGLTNTWHLQNNLSIFSPCYHSTIQWTGENKQFLPKSLDAGIDQWKLSHSIFHNWFQSGRKGILDFFYTSPQSFKIMFLICWLSNFGDFYWILIVWFIKLSVQTFNQ